MMRRDPSLLPADLGSRAAIRFYLHRLAILAALIGLAALVPAAVVLIGRGSGTPAKILLLVLLVFGGLYAIESGRWSLSGGGVLALNAVSLRFREEDEEDKALLPGDRRRWSALLRLVPGGRLAALALELLRGLFQRMR